MPRSRWDSREEARRDIVNHALRLYQQRSYPAVGMRDVADSLHVGVATLYGHVRTKEELLAWTHLERSRQFHATIEDLAGEATSFAELYVPWSAAFFPLYALTGIHLGPVLVRPDRVELIGEEASLALAENAMRSVDLAVTAVRRLLGPDGTDERATMIVELAWATMQGLADHYSGDRHLLHQHSWRALATTFADAMAKI